MVTEKQMTLGMDYSGQDVTGWFASEKFDGCRAYWDGAQLWTRGGNVIKAPAWFTEGLPPVHLDCELWAGRGNLEAARLATQFGKFTPDCRLLIHDVPQAPGNWAQRIASAPRTAHAEPVTVWRLDSLEAMLKLLAGVLALGGEGLVIRNPATTTYETGRSYNLLKVKPEFVGM